MKIENENSNNTGRTKGIGFGLVLMLIGLVFLGNNFGLIPDNIRHIIISWQMLLIVIGAVHLFKGKLVSAMVLLLIGSFFILPKIKPDIHVDFVHVYWPILLIGAGFVILLQRVLNPKWGFECNDNNNCNKKWNERHFKKESAPGGFSKNSVFGGGDHIVLDPVFKGGELNAVFGGLTLDLRRTNLAEGETYLEVNAVFGGITIYVPSNWVIETHLDSVFGGFQDNRVPSDPIDSTRKLIISGACVFGGGEIRN